MYRVPKTDVLETLLRLTKAAQDTVLIFLDVTSIDSYEFMEHPYRRGKLTYFNDKLLIVKMPASKHEKAVTVMMDNLKNQFIQMGVPSTDIQRIGTTTYFEQSGGAAAKEADDGFLPWVIERAYGDSFPTMAVECGNSQSMPALRRAKD